MLAGLPVTSITNSSSGSGYWFSRFAAATAKWTGSSSAFVTAVTVVAVWAITGPFFSYSDSKPGRKDRNDHCDISDGFLDSKYAEQGRKSSAD